MSKATFPGVYSTGTSTVGFADVVLLCTEIIKKRIYLESASMTRSLMLQSGKQLFFGNSSCRQVWSSFCEVEESEFIK